MCLSLGLFGIEAATWLMVSQLFKKKINQLISNPYLPTKMESPHYVI